MALLLAAAAGSWALLFRAGGRGVLEDEPAELGVGYYATDARLSGTGDDGRILYRVFAITVRQTPADGSVSLERVTIDYGPAARNPWTLRADTGTIPRGGKIIQLDGNVVAETRAADAVPATIRTDHLSYDTRTDVASTDRDVTIDYAGSAVHASGMRASLGENRLELLARVRGTYVR
jgi:lipopolysaccharide export system protein LptC